MNLVSTALHHHQVADPPRVYLVELACELHWLYPRIWGLRGPVTVS